MQTSRKVMFISLALTTGSDSRGERKPECQAKGKKKRQDIFLTCSTSSAFVRFTSTAVLAGMMAQMTLLFEFKLSPGALHNTTTVVKESFEEQRGIIKIQLQLFLYV